MHVKEKSGTALLIESRPENHEALASELPGWDLQDLPADDVPAWSREPSSPDVVLVYARTHEEDRALELSAAVRENDALRNVPLLVAINIYQMPLAHDVQKLGKAGFVFTPVKASDLDDRLSSLARDPAERP